MPRKWEDFEMLASGGAAGDLRLDIAEPVSVDESKLRP